MAASLFTQLVGQVEQSTANPLHRVEAAVALREQVSEDADRVMDHFIARAREIGSSWTDIGDRLGVSRQAARQRFGPRLGVAQDPSLRPRLQACLAQAERDARADGSATIETHHLLAGLLAEGVAAAILEKLGITTDRIHDASRRLFGPTADPVDQTPERSVEAAAALDAAVRIARNACPQETDSFVGTEHLLAALALDPGSRARRVLNELDAGHAAAIKRELSCHLSLNPRRSRRHTRRHRS